MSSIEKVVIIGNGISGITAARHIRKKSNKKITVISSETNYFFSRTALMYVFMGHMRFEDTKPYEDWFWEKNKIDLVFDHVEKIHTATKELQVRSGKKNIVYDKLILAVGSKPNKFNNWSGTNLDGVQGLYSYQDLEKIEKNAKTAKKAVIVGGGLIGIEFAEMMLSRNINVTFLVREDRFWGNVLPKQEGKLIERHLIAHHVDLRFNTELDTILDNGQGKVKAIKTRKGEIIPCDIVGLTAGVSPNIDFIRSSPIETARGVKINEYFETTVPNIYAIGDCAEFTTPINSRRKIEQVWYTGRIMGETLAQTITGNRMAYNPGPWFNSAKFFDIEYQTYGWVFPELQANEAEFYWEHEKGKMCMHFVWDKSTGMFKGVNTFGIRLRHDIFDYWLKKDTLIDEVLANLSTANFDPEFYQRHEKQIIGQFNQQTDRNVMLKPKQWWKKILNQSI